MVHHLRGLNGSKSALPDYPEFYSNEGDFCEVVKLIKERYPNYKLYSAAMCGGAGIVGNYVNGYKPNPGIKYIGDFKGHK